MPFQYTPQDQYHPNIDVHQTSDFVIGGPTGESNRPLKDLIDNNLYNYNRLLRFEDVLTLSANYTFDPATDLRRLVAYVFGGSNKVFTLPALNTVAPGTIITIITEIATAHCLKVQSIGQLILNGSDSRASLYMHDGERLMLAAEPAGWKVIHADGNFDIVGDTKMSYARRKNTLILNGNRDNNTLLSRDNYARLFEFITLYLTDGQEVVSDQLWLSNIKYQGCFSWGDGVSTFRLPDARGLAERGLDLNRGIDLGREHDYAGGYEDDALKQHNHSYNRPRTDTVGTRYENNTLKNGSDRGLWSGDGVTTGNTGDATETRVKNIGKLPLIYF